MFQSSALQKGIPPINPVLLTIAQLARIEILLSSARIRRVPPDFAKAERFIEQCRNALSELPSIKNHQLRYNGGYDAAHDVGEALMAAYGFRTANGQGQHVTLGEILLILFEETSAQNAAEDFDELRISRNQSRYVANPLGKAQADATVSCAGELLAQALLLLR